MTPSLGDQLRQVQRKLPTVVTGPHARWLETPEEQRVVTEEAAQFVKDAVLGKFKHQRTGRISASDLGGCPRRALLSFHGYPQVGDDPDGQELMSMGTHDHIFWQLEGLSMGYMRQAEVWMHDPAAMVGGSMDAELHDGTPFELKTVMWGPYREVVREQRQPRKDHWMQFDYYADETGNSIGSVVYQERGTGAFHEFRVERDDAVNRARLSLQHALGNHIADGTLPRMLADCEARSGSVYRTCPFRKSCPKAGRKVERPAVPLR